MDRVKQSFTLAKLLCAITIFFVGYNWFILLLLKMTPEQTEEFVLNGKIWVGYFFITNVWHDYLYFRLLDYKNNFSLEE